MKKYAIIVAGGSGIRMGTTVPKQFLLLNGKSVLWHTINAFINTYKDIEIIIVLPKEHLQIGEEIKNSFENKASQISLTIGGEARFHSVKNGLQLVQEESVVFVHDAVRCLVDKDLIERCYHQAIEQGSAIPVVAATDSIRLSEGKMHKGIDRNNVQIVQTPQTFLSSILLPAFKQNYNETFTDEATVVEASGGNVFLCEGSYNNIKITRPVDLVVAEKLIK